jgi:hypothetical protein
MPRGENACPPEDVGAAERMPTSTSSRSCGATTGFSTQASLLKSDQALPTMAGNLYIADNNHGVAPAGPGAPIEDRIRLTYSRTTTRPSGSVEVGGGAFRFYCRLASRKQDYTYAPVFNSSTQLRGVIDALDTATNRATGTD